MEGPTATTEPTPFRDMSLEDHVGDTVRFGEGKPLPATPTRNPREIWQWSVLVEAPIAENIPAWSISHRRTLM